MKRVGFGLIALALLASGLWNTPAQAQTCEARNDGNVPSYTNGTPNPIICDTHGSQRMLMVDGDGNEVTSTAAEATATEAAPTYTEGASSSLSLDLSGNLRTTLGTLLSGEDQTNNLLMTSGGAVRSTTMASAVTTNTTSTAVALPVGSKSIYGSVTGTGAITQTQAIYGGITSGVTSTTGILLCTLTLSGTTAVYDACPVMTANFLYYIVVTTATTGTSASGTVTAMY